MNTKFISIIFLIAFILTLLFCSVGCAEVISETPIDAEFIAAYDAMETIYEYKYDWYHGDFKLLPVYKQVHHAEVYKVQYQIIYSDGNSYTEWREVDKVTYEEAEKALAAMGEAIG